MLRDGCSWAQVAACTFRGLVTDLDGTLLGPGGRVTPRTARALDAVRGAGVRVAAAASTLVERIRIIVFPVSVSSRAVIWSTSAPVVASLGLPSLRGLPRRPWRATAM